MILKWLLSRTVRQAVQMYRHVGRLLHSQRDILEPQAFDAIQGSVNSLRQTVRQGASNEAIAQGMENLEQTANKWLSPHAYPGARENVEVMLVAIAVAMAIRTFFLQPFKIPTNSMWPTYYGMTPEVFPPGTAAPGALAQVFRFVAFGAQRRNQARFHPPGDGVAGENDQAESVRRGVSQLVVSLISVTRLASARRSL